MTVRKFFAPFEAMRWDPADTGSVDAIMAWLAADDVVHGLIGAGKRMALSIGRGDAELILEPGEWIVRDPARRYAVFPEDAFKAAGFVEANGYMVIGRDSDGKLRRYPARRGSSWDREVYETMREGVGSYRHADRCGYDVVLAALVEVEV